MLLCSIRNSGGENFINLYYRGPAGRLVLLGRRAFGAAGFGEAGYFGMVRLAGGGTGEAVVGKFGPAPRKREKTS